MSTRVETATQPDNSSASLLALLHIASPALPIGAFAYSQGLEFALDHGWCNNRAQVEEWIHSNLQYGIGQLDLPLYLRLYSSWKAENASAIHYWNQLLLSFRETKELYLEDIQVGSAFQQWHLKQDPERQALVDLCPNPSVTAMNSLAAVLSNIEVEHAMLGFAWSWVENQIACASKAMPMGQSDGQAILARVVPVIVATVKRAQEINDDLIGTGLMGTAIASSLHEHQYSRLFRS